MVPVEKMQELGAVVNFWKVRVSSLTAELCVLHDLKTNARPTGDRYAADRLLREIKKKAGDVANAERLLHAAERDLNTADESLGHLMHTSVTGESSRAAL